MLRITIFVIYQKNNHLTQDVIYLLNELKTVSDKIVIVVNGHINEIDILKKKSDYLIERENLGFDAGAYKTVLNDKNVQEIIKQSDELVFCNDTFYGPLIPFKDIFKKMDSFDCDFWGLSLIDRGIEVFIQSNFLVFRKGIINKRVIEDYFRKNINEKTTDFNEVLRFFERNLFSYLVNNNYCYSYYCKVTTIDIGESVIFDKVPILRKKAFGSQEYQANSILNTLFYIKENYNYPIKMILEDIQIRFGITILENDFEDRKIINSKKRNTPYIYDIREKIKKFIQKNKSVYLYGLGRYAEDIIEIEGLDNIAGFIVSDNQQTDLYHYGKKIKKFIEIQNNYNLPIIVAMGIGNTKQVEKNLQNFSNILFLWDLK